MRLLALDTSSVACSVALQIDDVITDRHEEQPREHTRLLMPMIDAVLKETSVSLRDLDAIVLGNGPGSFIGMRIAASVAQGLAFGASLNIVPVSSMAAVAARVFDKSDAQEVVVAQDAHMQEVYLGVYQCGEDGLPVPSMPEKLHGITNILDLDEAPNVSRFAAGFGWQRYPDLLAVNSNRIEKMTEILHPHASDLLGLAAVSLRKGEAIEPQDIVPAYLRQKVAEIPGRAS